MGFTSRGSAPHLREVRDWTTGKDGALLKPAEGKLDSWMMWVEDMRYEDSTTLAQYTDKFNEIQNFMHTECKECDRARAEHTSGTDRDPIA